MEKSADNTREDLLAPDVATRRATDTPSDALSLVGYLGEGESEQYRHLYRDLEFKVFVRIPTEAIVDRCSETDDDLTHGRSVVWIKSDAVLLLCEEVRVGQRQPLTDGDPWPWPWG